MGWDGMGQNGGSCCCGEGGRQQAPVLYPSLRVFDTGMGRKETLFSKNSALSQLDKHLK